MYINAIKKELWSSAFRLGEIYILYKNSSKAGFGSSLHAISRAILVKFTFEITCRDKPEVGAAAAAAAAAAAVVVVVVVYYYYDYYVEKTVERFSPHWRRVIYPKRLCFFQKHFWHFLIFTPYFFINPILKYYVETLPLLFRGVSISHTEIEMIDWWCLDPSFGSISIASRCLETSPLLRPLQDGGYYKSQA